jgi:hypothetical protein
MPFAEGRYRRDARDAEAALGDAVFDRAWAEGRAMKFEDAMRLRTMRERS